MLGVTWRHHPAGVVPPVQVRWGGEDLVSYPGRRGGATSPRILLGDHAVAYG